MIVTYLARKMENAQAMRLQGVSEEQYDNELLENFLSLFKDVRAKFSKGINTTFSSNAGFKTGFKTLFTENSASAMEKQRVVTNLIEEAIKNKVIEEECK